VSQLVIVVPLKEGASEQARALLKSGPPIDLEKSGFVRHQVHATKREIVFVFDSPEPGATLRLPGEDPSLWKVARAWQKVMAGKPRKAETVFSWTRAGGLGEGFSYESTPGPGGSEGGDVFSP
jgi:hypothetical protein